ncbi:MAG: OmpA family protein [Dysgonamonadaceae bacterium]|jgi:outer membrane protein OmpA-like peptidoglycan-associated protein|nr:OmpA family protein [Dysgonamonadaceae bacterium]
MRKVAVFLVALVALTYANSVNAQFQQSKESTLEEALNKNQYVNNWFISLGGNANILMAEQDKAYDLSKRISFGGAFTVGKWFTPDFGARIQANGGVLRGFNFVTHRTPYYFTNNNDSHIGTPIGGYVSAANGYKLVSSNEAKKGIKDGFLQEFNYGTATVDLMFNLTNLFRGHYQELNKFDFIPFAGVGAIAAFNNKYTTPDFYSFVLKLGFRANYNVTPDIGVFLEAQGNVTDPEFDGYKGTAMFDAVSNLGLGVQYTFNKGFTSLGKLTQDEIDRLNKRVNENRHLIENHQDILERQQDLLDKLQKCCDEKEVVVTQVVEKSSLPGYIRFVLDSYAIENSEQQKLIDVVEYLNGVSDSELLLIGYADKNTGNPKYNLELSHKRVDAVVAELISLGINQDRLVIDWKGDQEQPFSQNDWNRVVIMVERK